MKQIDIDADKVVACTKNSFSNPDNFQSSNENKILSDDKKWAQQIGIILHP